MIQYPRKGGDLPCPTSSISISAVRCVSPKVLLNFTPKYGWLKAPVRLRLFPIQAVAPASMDVKPVLTVTGRFTVDFSLAKSIFITTLVQSTAFSVLRFRNRSGLDDPPQLIQASLFSHAGISTGDLLACTEFSRSTLKKRLKDIENSGLLLTQRHGREKCYKLDLAKFEQQA